MSEATFSQVRQLQTQVSAVQSVLDDIGSGVVLVNTRQEQLSAEVIDLRTAVEGYFEQAARQQSIQTAETRLVKIRQELQKEYGHYADVRRRATGILQAVDAGLVSDETIQHTTEDLMMATPRYWLAPGLVAIAAWMRRDKGLADTAQREALVRNADKAALFFALVTRRSNHETSLGWLNHYLDRQNPAELSREFVVILDAVTTGAFGPAAVHKIDATISRWMSDIRQLDGADETQAAVWTEQLGGYRGGEQLSMPTLKAISSTHPALVESMARVRSHQLIYTHYSELFGREVHVPRELEVKVDNILNNMVTEFDTEELPLRRDEIKQQAIVQHNGDLDLAAADADRIGSSLDETQTFEEILVAASFHPEQSKATVGTQRLAISLGKDWLISGYDKLTADIRNDMPTTIRLTIDDWSGTVHNPPKTDELLAALEAHVDRQTKTAVDKVSFPGTIFIGPAITVILLLTGAWLGFLIGVIASAGFGYYQYQQIEKRKQDIINRGHERKQKGAAQLRDAIAESVDYYNEWYDEDQKAHGTRQYLCTLNPGSSGLVGKERAS